MNHSLTLTQTLIDAILHSMPKPTCTSDDQIFVSRQQRKIKLLYIINEETDEEADTDGT